MYNKHFVIPRDTFVYLSGKKII